MTNNRADDSASGAGGIVGGERSNLTQSKSQVSFNLGK